jgi:chemotaxis-related protein WspD
MTSAPHAPRHPDGVLNDCWNLIGVRGDRSCPVLEQYVHCHNCPVYSAGAAEVLDVEAPGDYLADRTAYFAERLSTEETTTRSVVIFRVAAEWLALPASVVIEVAHPQPIHSLPHRSNRVVLGLASVRGELLVCVSLSGVIGAEAPPSATPGSSVFQRMLVLGRDTLRVACPVDAVHGIHRFRETELTDLPATIARAAITYSTAVLPWQGHSVGMLDGELLFYTLRRSLE